MAPAAASGWKPMFTAASSTGSASTSTGSASAAARVAKLACVVPEERERRMVALILASAATLAAEAARASGPGPSAWPVGPAGGMVLVVITLVDSELAGATSAGATPAAG